MNKNKDIDTILADLLAGEKISETDKKILEQDIKENSSTKKLNSFIKQVKLSGEHLHGRTDKSELFDNIAHTVRAHKHSRFIWRKLSVAAGIIILLGCGALFWYQSSISSFSTSDDMAAISLRNSQIELVLPRGETIYLSQKTSIDSQLVLADKTAQITNENNTLVYTAKSAVEEQTFHTIRIPKGGEYILQLADHTKVYMNSNSELRYPINFSGNTREVYLSGEAYFQVAKNENQPFIVHAKNVAVRVLGTSFNVNAYSDDDRVTTTLEEGKVRMSAGAKVAVLTPGIQSVYSESEQELVSRRVNTELYTSWRKGYYLFEGETLENIMNLLSNWYDIEVFYANEKVKNLKFGGRLKRYDNISYLLRQFEETNNVTFKIQGKTIIVQSK